MAAGSHQSFDPFKKWPIPEFKPLTKTRLLHRRIGPEQCAVYYDRLAGARYP
jgi:hypothetical protein